MFLSKDHIVVTTQHIRNIETLYPDQNNLLKQQYLSIDGDASVESSARDKSKRNTSAITRAATKDTWTRERPVTRSRQLDTAVTKGSKHVTESGTGLVNIVKDADPSKYREAIQSVDKLKWYAAMQEEL